MKIDAVIFDVDGTLWDTTDIAATAMNKAAAEFGIQDIEPFTGDILKREFGKPMNIIMDNLFPKEEESMKADVLKLYCEYLHEILKNAPKEILYPGVLEGFEALSKKCKVGVVSNCQSGYIELFLKRYGLEQYVVDTECYGDTLLSKGENIKLLMERNNIQNALYVGDTIGDYKAAVFAGTPFVFARYGFGKVENPYKAIDDIREVLELV